jgi:uncharacterized protein YbjT (DUF2867 family)
MSPSTDVQGRTSEPKLLLVIGSTGKQGSSVARRLLKRGHEVRGLTRKPEGTPAQELRSLGAEIVRGDLDDRNSLRRAIAGRDAVFIVATAFEKGPEAETREAVNAMDVAREAGVRQVVYSSVSDADRHTGIPHFDSKARAEEHLAGLNYTIVAPVFFMDNMTGPFMAQGLANGVLAMALSPRRKLQEISVRDIGRFATLAIEQPSRFRGRRINIAGDELSPSEIAGVLPSGRSGNRAPIRRRCSSGSSEKDTVRTSPNCGRSIRRSAGKATASGPVTRTGRRSPRPNVDRSRREWQTMSEGARADPPVGRFGRGPREP